MSQSCAEAQSELDRWLNMYELRKGTAPEWQLTRMLNRIAELEDFLASECDGEEEPEGPAPADQSGIIMLVIIVIVFMFLASAIYKRGRDIRKNVEV